MSSSDKTTHGTRIKSRRSELQLTQTSIADFIGVTPPTIGQWERNETTPKGEHLISLAEILQTSPEWLITGSNKISRKGTNVTVHQLPVIPFSQLDKNFKVSTVGPRPDQTRSSTRDLSPNSFAIVVVGDAMVNPGGGPSMPQGTVLIVDQDQQHSDNSFVIAATRKSGVLCRQFSVDGPYRWLKALNPDYSKLEFTRGDVILGTVVAIETDLV